MVNGHLDDYVKMIFKRSWYSQIRWIWKNFVENGEDVGDLNRKVNRLKIQERKSKREEEIWKKRNRKEWRRIKRSDMRVNLYLWKYLAGLHGLLFFFYMDRKYIFFYGDWFLSNYL